MFYICFFGYQLVIVNQHRVVRIIDDPKFTDDLETLSLRTVATVTFPSSHYTPKEESLALLNPGILRLRELLIRSFLTRYGMGSLRKCASKRLQTRLLNAGNAQATTPLMCQMAMSNYNYLLSSASSTRLPF